MFIVLLSIIAGVLPALTYTVFPDCVFIIISTMLSIYCFDQALRKSILSAISIIILAGGALGV